MITCIESDISEANCKVKGFFDFSYRANRYSRKMLFTKTHITMIIAAFNELLRIANAEVNIFRT